jgi:hypothetical protein
MKIHGATAPYYVLFFLKGHGNETDLKKIYICSGDGPIYNSKTSSILASDSRRHSISNLDSPYRLKREVWQDTVFNSFISKNFI